MDKFKEVRKMLDDAGISVYAYKPNAFGEKNSGEGVLAGANFRGRAFGEQGTAMNAGAGAEVDDPVGARHQFVVVLDDEQGVTFVAEREEGFDESVVVAGVQADGGLVENVKDAGQIGAELGGQADALGFAAGKGVGRSVEGEVAEADVVEKFEALGDLRDDVLSDELASVVECEGAEVRDEFRGSGAEQGG